MILHYGCKEQLSTKFYAEDCKIMPAIVQDHDTNTTLICEICKKSNNSQKSFVLHITERHFSQRILENLPKKPPFKCPFKGCNKERRDKHSIMVHYGVDHNVTMDLYFNHLKVTDQVQTNINSHKTIKKQFKEVDLFTTSKTVKKEMKEVDIFKPTMISCNFCKEKKTTFVTTNSLNFHLILTHFFTDIFNKTPIHCPKCKEKFPAKNDFAKHFIDKHMEKYMKKKEYEKFKVPKQESSTLSLNKSLSEEIGPIKTKVEAPLPKSREMKTVHGLPREKKSIHTKEMQTLHEVKSPTNKPIASGK